MTRDEVLMFITGMIIGTIFGLAAGVSFCDFWMHVDEEDDDSPVL